VRGGVRLVTDLGRRRRHPPWLTPSPSPWRGGSMVSAWWCASGR